MSVSTLVITPVVTTVGCEFDSLDDAFYTCGQTSSFLVTTPDFDMYLCSDCYSDWNA